MSSIQELVFVLGRESHLSVAEIAAVLGDWAEWGKTELSKEALVLPTPRHFEGEAREISHDDTPSNGVRSLAVLEMTKKIMARLGGTIKIGEVWRTVTCGKTSEVDAGGKTSGVDRETPDVEEPAFDVSERVTEAIGRFILDQTTADRKVHFGYSVYDLGGGTTRVREVRESLRRGAATQKAWLTERERKVRWVTSREPTLSSVIVAKNHLLPEENGVEVLMLVGADRIHLARTLAVQPYQEWSRRDYGRPSRDARSGMLPPKLARAMINIALARNPKFESRISKQNQISKIRNLNIVSDFGFRNSDFTLLDPFCGSGTILTEAMALGVPKIIGTDASAEAVEDAKANIAWTSHRMQRSGDLQPAPATASGVATDGGLKASATTRGGITVTQCDVRRLSQCVRERVDAIVTEPYLGPPAGREVTKSKAQNPNIFTELRTLYIDAFREFAKVLKPGGRVVFIVPIFRERGVVLDITRDVARFGFHHISSFPVPLRDHPLLRGREDLSYARPDQRVGRRILVFTFGSPET